MQSQTRKVHPLLLIPVLFAVLAMSACTNGGAIVSAGTGGCGTTLTSVSGIWLGSGNFVGGGTTVGMIANGDLMILQITGDSPFTTPIMFRFYVGRYNSTTLTGTAEVYDGSGRLLEANQPLSLNISGTLNVTIGAATTLLPLCPLTDGTATAVYNRPTLSADGVNMIAGNWLYSIPTATPPYNLTYTFDSNNLLTGQDDPGCVYNGIWVDPNLARNLYRIEQLSLFSGNAGACDGFDDQGTVEFEGGGYNGFAFYLDANPASYQLIWVAVANGRAAYFTRFDRTSAPPALPLGVTSATPPNQTPTDNSNNVDIQCIPTPREPC